MPFHLSLVDNVQKASSSIMFQLLVLALPSLFSLVFFSKVHLLNTIVQQKMMVGIMIPNFVMSIGDVYMEHPKNLNVLVVLLGIIMQIVVIGLIVLIVHVLKKQQQRQYLEMTTDKILQKKEGMILMDKMMIDLLLLKNPKRKRKNLEN